MSKRPVDISSKVATKFSAPLISAAAQRGGGGDAVGDVGQFDVAIGDDGRGGFGTRHHDAEADLGDGDRLGGQRRQVAEGAGRGGGEQRADRWFAEVAIDDGDRGDLERVDGSILRRDIGDGQGFRAGGGREASGEDCAQKEGPSGATDGTRRGIG